MIPYVASYLELPLWMIKDHVDCIDFLAALPERSDGHWTCHALARAFGVVTKDRWQVADGYFGATIGQQHSWLWTPHGRNGSVILDVYPVAATMPQLLDAGPGSPWGVLYRDAPRSYSLEARLLYDAEAVEAMTKGDIRP